MHGANITRLLVFCLLVFFSSRTVVYSKSIEQQSVLAALTLNFARFTRWPISLSVNTDPVFNLCVFGDNTVQSSFDNIDKTKVNGKTIRVISITRLRYLSQCQILYISGLERNILIQVLLELKGQAILTVGENMEFIQLGGMVGLTKVKGKMQININLPIVEHSSLVVSSRLLKLANIFNFPYSIN